MNKVAYYKEEILKMAREESDGSKTIAGLGLAGASTLPISSAIKSGQLTGRKTMYHNTDKKNVKDIMESGLKSSKASDPNNLTNRVLKHVSDDKKKGKVYMGNKKFVAKGAGLTDSMTKNMGFFGPDMNAAKRHFNENKKTLKVNMPLSEIKKVDNPELLGAKNFKEYSERLEKLRPNTETPLNKAINYHAVGKGTTTHQGDVSSKYIKGSKNYKKNSIKEILKHIKGNKKMFLKGVGKAGLGLAGIGTGLKMVADDRRKSKDY